MKTIGRRAFLGMTAAASAASAFGALKPHPAMAAAAEGGLKKAVSVSMLAKELGYLDKFKLAVDVGFQGIEIGTIADEPLPPRSRRLRSRPASTSTAS